MQKEHLLHLITGEGKGKTSAAMGMALRMLGHERPVLVAQFMKDGTSGELIALARFPLCHMFEGLRMQGFAWHMSDKDIHLARAAYQEALLALEEQIDRIKPGLLVLDELNVTLAMNLVQWEQATALIDRGLVHGDVVVTGRYASPKMEALADYVTVLQARKHPFDEGLPAREGIEW
ncbi:MAG: cob(I)yrinic acid a,c-diamide adenosyltransferase [Christensenellales bacterium]